jgi:hypothetical protein
MLDGTFAELDFRQVADLRVYTLWSGGFAKPSYRGTPMTC